MQKNEILTLSVEEMNNLGNGVAHLPDGMVVFVTGAVTGDTVEAKVIKVNKTYAVARTERVIKPSSIRTEDGCPLDSCGGCIYQRVTYEHECERKREYVRNAFRKAGLADVAVSPIRTTGILDGYRNKAQYPVGRAKDGRTVAGFFASSSHRIVPTDECRLQPKIFSEIVRAVCEFCDKNQISPYDEETGKGLLRHVCLRYGVETGEVMLCLVVTRERFPASDALVAEMTGRFPAIVSVMLNLNRENTNAVLGEEFFCLFGRPYIEDILCGVRFKIPAGAFYQVNHDACELLYRTVAEKADLHGGETVLDLYCGIGTIGLSLAGKARRIVGVEIVPQAVERAEENARRNGIRNARFFCGDASDTKRFLAAAEWEDEPLGDATVILDPPRKGSTEELISCLAERKFSRIVYVSCNPDTLARDCALFRDCGYRIDGDVVPVDLFPRTGHVETVVLMSRKDT